MTSLSTSTTPADLATPDVPPAVHEAVARGEISADAAALVGAFASFAPAFRRLVERDVGTSGISAARMRLLHLLQMGGPQIMSDLRRQLGVTARNVTQLVDGVEADGLARRTDHPTDRRATVVELTERGRELVTKGWSRHVRNVAALFDALAPEDRPVLLRLVNELRHALEDMGIDANCGPDAHGP